MNVETHGRGIITIWVHRKILSTIDVDRLVMEYAWSFAYMSKGKPWTQGLYSRKGNYSDIRKPTACRGVHNIIAHDNVKRPGELS